MSAAALLRLRLLANCAFGQRFLANSPSRLGSAKPRPGVPPLAPCPPAGRGGHGPFTPLRCPGLGEGSPAVTNPKGTLIVTRVSAAGRGSLLGVVTARSFGTRWRPVSRLLGARVAAFLGARCGTFLTRFREPGQCSKPNSEASLGLRLSSARPRGRSVGFPVARHLVWGRGGRARSRRIWRSTGTAPAADPLGQISRPAPILGNRSCAAGHVGEDDLDSRLQQLGSPHCREESSD